MVTGCIPAKETVIKYTPGGSAEKLYAPVSPLIVDLDPCNSGEVIVTVAPGNGSPNPFTFTTPASDAVVWLKTVVQTRENTHAISVTHERFVIVGPLGVDTNIARKKPMRQFHDCRPVAAFLLTAKSEIKR